MNDHVTFEPAPVAVAAGPRTATRTQAAARIGLLGIGAAAVLAAAILAFGYVASPAGTLAAGSTDDATTSAGILELGGGRGGHGFGHMFGGITITAISGTSISLETEDGWTRTITVDADTTFTKGGDDVALGDLAVGDQIGFRQTLEDDGSWTIDAVAVILPHVGGEVTAVNGSTITVEQRDGTAALADIEVGMFLVAEGEEDAGGAITAVTVKAAEPGELRGPGHGFRFGPGGPRDVVPDASATPDEDASAS
jgi:hypothetical protein